MELHIANTLDTNRLSQFYAMLASMFSSNRQNKTCFHVVVTGISGVEKVELESFIQSHNGQIVFYTIDPKLIQLFPLGPSWTIAVYYRLLLFNLIPKEVGRLLYLDTDTLVLKDLSGLFSIDLNEFPLAAVYDNYVKTRPELGIHEEGEYFNSGMMLIDLPVWNRTGVSEKAMAYLQQYPERIKFVDQDALNVVLKDNWKRISEHYNFMFSYVPYEAAKTWYQSQLGEICILHFTLQRPWNMLCKNRYRELYLKFHKQSPGGRQPAITDFSIWSVNKWLGLRVAEAYQDAPSWVKVTWKKMKSFVN